MLSGVSLVYLSYSQVYGTRLMLVLNVLRCLA
jgi:hypothetical protein